jgi:hypothetical protein
MGTGNYQIEQLLALLPEGWQDKAKELGAFERGREVKTPGDLLRLILLYLSEGRSFAGTSALVQMGGDCRLSKTAVYNRIRNSGEWLRWLCENFYRHAGLLVDKPAWLEGRDVYLVDGSEVVTGGNEKAYYMLHYCLDLFTLGMKEFHITGMENGEKLSNFGGFGEDAIVIGDRAYGTLPGISYLRDLGSGYVVRLRGKAFRVYNAEGEGVSITETFKGLGEGESGSIRVYCRIEGEAVPMRICGLRKDKESEEEGLRRLEKTNQRKRQGKEVSEGQKEYNKYIIVATSLEEAVSAEEVLELYRARWQIELAFKRLKSLFGYGQMPMKVETSAYAWFYGKLLLAALCEAIVNKGRFPLGGGEDGEYVPVGYERLSLWRELYIVRVLVTGLLLGSYGLMNMSAYIHKLSTVCADSKRKRKPRLCGFGSSDNMVEKG